MNPHVLDAEALIRAVLLALGAGLAVAGIGYFAMRPPSDWARRKPVLAMLVVGVAILIGTGTYFLWPTLAQVPKLDGLSQAEAEDMLVKLALTPSSRPQHSEDVPAGRVIPGSQAPSPGLRIRRGEAVNFAISVKQAGNVNVQSPITSGQPAPSLSLHAPKSNSTVALARSADGVFRLTVTGAMRVTTPTGDFRVLLWVRPVSPPSDTPGWYLQRPPINGVSGIAGDGAWSGLAQVGNATYPPTTGGSVDVAASLTRPVEVSALFAESGIVTRPSPVGQVVATATNVRLEVR